MSRQSRAALPELKYVAVERPCTVTVSPELKSHVLAAYATDTRCRLTSLMCINSKSQEKNWTNLPDVLGT